MNLTIFLVLAAFALFFIPFGYWLGGKADIFQISGFTILFILGMTIIPGTPTNLEIPTGSEITVSGNTYTTETTFTVYEDITVGVLIAAMAILGFVQVYFERKQEDD